MKGIIHLLTKNILFFYTEISSDLDIALLLVIEYKLYKHSILNLRVTNDLIMSYTCFLAILYKWPTKEMGEIK